MSTSADVETILSSGPEEKKDEIYEGKEAASKTMKVTLLSGFLGSGKTTLLKLILRLNNELPTSERLKIAVIVNDMGEINLDAEEIKSSKVIQEDAEMVEMHNGCICCTLRGDLLKTVKSLSQEGSFVYLVIESTGISEPLPVAQTFVMDVDSMTETAGSPEENNKDTVDDKNKEKLKVATDEKKSLFHYAKLDTLVTVVDPINMYDVLSSMETLADMDNASGMAGNAPDLPDELKKQHAAVVAAAMNMPAERLRNALKA